MRALRRVDIAIGQLVRIIERLPELEYDRYILSDHGQTLSRLFVQVSGGRSLEEVTRSMLGPGAGAIDSRPGHTGKRHLGVARQLARYRRTEARGIVHRFINHGG